MYGVRSRLTVRETGTNSARRVVYSGVSVGLKSLRSLAVVSVLHDYKRVMVRSRAWYRSG